MKKKRKPVIFADLCDLYLAGRLRLLGPRTVSTTIQVRDSSLGALTFGKNGTLTTKAVGQWLTEEGVRRKWRPASRVRVQTQISSVLRFAMETGLLDDKDVPKMPPRPRVPKTLGAKYLEKDKLDVLLRACLEEDEALHALVLCIAYSGCRVGEIARLTWDDVKGDTFEVTSRKGHVVLRRSVPLHEYVANVFRAMGEKWGMKGTVLRRRDGSSWHDTHHRRIQMPAWDRARKKAGVKVGFRELRHTFIHMMRKSGVPLDVIAEIVGHLDLNTTALVYAPLNNAQKIEAIDKIG